MIGTSYAAKSDRDERREKGMRDTPRTCARSRSEPTRWMPTGSRSGRHATSRTVGSSSTSGSRCRTAACRCDSASCGAWHGYFKESAVATRDALQRYETVARSMGLVPAQTRAARRRLNLAFPGWEPYLAILWLPAFSGELDAR